MVAKILHNYHINKKYEIRLYTKLIKPTAIANSQITATGV